MGRPLGQLLVIVIWIAADFKEWGGTGRAQPHQHSGCLAYLRKFVDTQTSPIANGTSNQGAAAA